MTERMIQQAAKMGIHLDSHMAGQFARYQELLIDWNTRINLTAITEPIAVQDKHFLDSLSCILAMEKRDGRLIDIGTGAGFPGLPIKIALPEMDVTLLDSLNKRINFLNEVIGALELKHIRSVHGRAEECARKDEHRARYDYAFARAVARLNVLCEYCLPFVRKGGLFISQKGVDYAQELEESENAIAKLGAVVEKVIPVEIPDTDYTRVLILMRKTADTADKYPRHHAKIEKSPL